MLDFRSHRHQLLRVFDQLLSLGCQPCRALAAIEQGDPEAAFEIVDAHRNRGLRRMETLGRGGETSQPTDPIKRFELFERHGISGSDWS